MKRILPYVSVLTGLAGIFHVPWPFGCVYGVRHWPLWPWEHCPSYTMVTWGRFHVVDVPSSPYYITNVQAFTLMALGVIWIALRRSQDATGGGGRSSPPGPFSA